MDPFKPLTTPGVFRWTARILGSLLVLLFAVIGTGEALIPLMGSEKLLATAVVAAVGMMLLGVIAAWRWERNGGALALSGFLLLVLVGGSKLMSSPFLTADEKLTSAGMVMMLPGLVVALRWEGIGGAVALSGCLLCGLLNPRAMMSPLVAGGVAGCLYLLAWWTSDRSKWREHGGPRRLGITAVVLGGALLLIWIWLGVGARSMEARVHNLPNLAGQWVGTSTVQDGLVHNRKVGLDITLVPDGAFQGVVGDATIVKGHVKSNLKASRIGYLLNQMGEPTYTMSLELSGPPVATPGQSLPHADLRFDLRGGQMVGALHLTDIPYDLRDLHVVLHRKDR